MSDTTDPVDAILDRLEAEATLMANDLQALKREVESEA
jgi:hypothetical protein